MSFISGNFPKRKKAPIRGKKLYLCYLHDEKRLLRIDDVIIRIIDSEKVSNVRNRNKLFQTGENWIEVFREKEIRKKVNALIWKYFLILVLEIASFSAEHRISKFGKFEKI